MSKVETMTAERFDELVDEGKEDVLQYFDLENARRGGAETKRINIDLPSEFLADLDQEAARRGITRQSLIKVWLYERLHSDSVTVLGESALERVTSGIIRPQDWPKETSGLRESIISILKSKGQALSVLELARELENLKEPRTQSTKHVESAKGGRAAKRLIREGK